MPRAPASPPALYPLRMPAKPRIRSTYGIFSLVPLSHHYVSIHNTGLSFHGARSMTQQSLKEATVMDAVKKMAAKGIYIGNSWKSSTSEETIDVLAPGRPQFASIAAGSAADVDLRKGRSQGI